MKLESSMDMQDLVRVNHLWARIYPFIADQILSHYLKKDGDVLEWGPFSGGVSFSLLGRKPAMEITIAVESPEVFSVMETELSRRQLTGKIRLMESPLVPLVYDDRSFDLVVGRGGYFFLDPHGEALREIFRVLKKGGIAFVGGGYGKDTPQEMIDGIAAESRILNDRLGRIRVSVEELEAMIAGSGLKPHIRVVEEGGLWLLFNK